VDACFLSGFAFPNGSCIFIMNLQVVLEGSDPNPPPLSPLLFMVRAFSHSIVFVLRFIMLLLNSKMVDLARK